MKPRELAGKTNRRLRAARRLAKRQERDKGGLFLVEGAHLIESALDRAVAVREVFCTGRFLERHGALAARLEAADWPTWVVSDGVLRGVAATEHPQGAVAVAEKPPPAPLPGVSDVLLVLALDGVADPGNVGTCVRSAHGFGASAVVLGAGCCDPFNAKAVRASAGSLFWVPVAEAEELARAVEELRESGARAVLADAHARVAVWDVDLRGPTVLVVGGEARGASEQVRSACEQVVAVPLREGAESLNAGVAASVVLFEAARQRAAGFTSRGRGGERQ